MTKKQYFKTLKELVDDRREMILLMQEDYKALEAQLHDEKYSQEHIKNEIIPVLQKMKAELTAFKDETQKRAQRLTNQLKAEITAADQIKGEELTDDAKLLQGGLLLTEHDVQGILDRHKGNRTMSQLALRYAAANEMKVNSIYMPAAVENSHVDNCFADVGYVIRRLDDTSEGFQALYDAVFSDGARTARYLNQDETEVSASLEGVRV